MRCALHRFAHRQEHRVCANALRNLGTVHGGVAASLFFTVRNMNWQFLLRSKSIANLAALAGSEGKTRPAKNVCRLSRVGCFSLHSLRKSSKTGSLHRAASCCCNSTNVSVPFARSAMNEPYNGCFPSMGFSYWKSPTKTMNG